MTVAELELEAIVLFDQWNLNDWTLVIGKRARSLGVCRYRPKVIEITRHHIENDPYPDVMDTLKHEIAHALVFLQYGLTVQPHGPEWKAMAEKVGCNPVACEATASVELRLSKPPGKWFAICPGCSVRFDYYRKPKILFGRYCAACGPDVGFLTVKPVE